MEGAVRERINSSICHNYIVWKRLSIEGEWAYSRIWKSCRYDCCLLYVGLPLIVELIPSVLVDVWQIIQIIN